MRTFLNIKYSLLAGVLFITACGGGHKEKNEDDTKLFRYNESSGITSLDPAFARGLENIWPVNQLFNGLLQMDNNLYVQPCIAKKWEVSDDGTVYTFYLRNDVYFHDSPVFPNGKGRKVVASDFVHSFLRILDDKVASPGRWIFNNIDRSKRSNNVGFVAENDTVLKIYLKYPFPPFPGLLTMQYCSVVPHEVVEKYGDDFRKNPVGTGPFVFKMWEENVKLILTKNEKYFEKDDEGNSLPYLDAISITFGKDEEVEFFEFIKGNLDFISGLDGSYKQQILDSKGKLKPDYADKIKMLTQPFLNTEYLGFLVDENLEIVKNSPLRKKEVRQAINYGFDRKQMIMYLRNNVGTPATSGFVPKGMASFSEEEVPGYTYNPQKAHELLAKAGYPNGKGMPEIVISTTSQYLDLCEFIQHQLQELGIKLKIDLNPAATHSELVARQGTAFFRKSWVADYPDAENYLALFYSKNFAPDGPNYTHFKNPEFDRLYELAHKTNSEKERYEIYRKMDRIIIEEAPVVPLYYDEVVRFVSPRVQNLGVNPMNLLTLKYVKKIPKEEKK